MAYEDHTPSGAAPVRARSNEPFARAPEPENLPPAAAGQPGHAPRNLEEIPLSPPPAHPYRPGISDDLLVPWGWLEVALFVILGVVGSVVVTWGMAELAVRVFSLKPGDVFGTTITTAKSVVV